MNPIVQRTAGKAWLAMIAALTALIVAPAVLRADDTDIYMATETAAASAPLVMFSIDSSSAGGAVYAGCATVGTGASMCAPAKYFRDNCPTCVLPLATEPLTYFHAMRYALRMVLTQIAGVKVGLMLSHNHEKNCTGPRPAVPTSQQRCSNGGYIARGFKLLDQVTVPGDPLLGIPDSVAPGPNTSELLAILDAMAVPSGSNAHSYQGKEMFFEMFRYLTGQGLYNGHNGYTDYGTPNLLNLDADRPAMDWDATIESLGRYVSPLTADLTCTKIFTLNFVLNGSNQDNDSDDAIDSDSAGGMVGLDLGNPDDKFENVIGYLHDVDLGRSETPFGTVPALTGKQNVTSYFFTKPTPLDSDPPTFDRTTTAYANQGGTVHPLPFAGDPSQLVGELRGAMQQILSVSTTFVSGSVPVNVFSRTQVLSDVYLALFQPDAAARPLWAGNMKKLKAKVVEVPCPVDAVGCTPSREVRLADALDADAIQDDGRIRNDALTFWTDGSRIAADDDKGIVAGRDGRHVSVGGAGQKIPGYLSAGGPGYLNSDTAARQLYINAATGTTLLPLNADLSTAAAYQTALNAASTGESLGLLQFIRGFDTYDADSDLNTTEIRPWLMADPLHSRPLPINYGALTGYSQENPAIFIAVATNDGLLHFVRNTTTGGSESGQEMWAFLPVDLLSIQKALATNAPVSKRLYGMDGSPSAYILDRDGDGTIECDGACDGSANDDRVLLYVGMRRGGRAYYAFDVTDPFAPPTLVWKAAPELTASALTSAACSASLAAGTALSSASPCAAELTNLLCSGDYCEMGYSFSQPRIGRVKTGVDGAGRSIIRPVVVFGGGYDPALNDYSAVTATLIKLGVDSPGSVNTNDLMGNAIYVVDAETGALIWKAVGPPSTSPGGDKVFLHPLLLDSIPSTLTIVDTNSDGFSDRIVVGDTGGNVWRADLTGDTDAPTDGMTTDDWKLTLLAQLGRHALAAECVPAITAVCTKRNDRRFFHEADFVLSKDGAGDFDGIVLGSGDREDPLDYGRVRVAGVETFAENWFFMIKDRDTGIGAASDSDPARILTPSDLEDVSSNCLQAASCQPDLSRGWRIRLSQGKGEKVLAAPLTAANRIYFTSYLPARSNETTTCGPSEGGGLFYAVNLKDATAVFNYNTSDGGTAASPNSALDRFDGLASAGIPTEVVYINLPDASGAEVKCALGSDLNCRALPGATRFRTFWYRNE